MHKRFRHIIMLVILLSGAIQALAQPFSMPDKVCVGTVRRYWVTDGLPGSVFTWKINGATQTSTVDFIDLNWSVAGVFNLQVQEHQINCDGDIQSGIITVVDFPTLVIHDPPSVCEPSTVDLTASTITTGSDTNLSLTYWTDAGGTTTLTNETNVSLSGTYYIKATNSTGCSVIKPIEVVVNPQPILKIKDPLAVCQPATIDLTAASVTAGSDAGLTYTYWTNPLATIALVNYTTVTETGSYFIKATNPVTGCSDVHVVNVTVNPLPKLVVNDPASVCQPNTVDLSAVTVTASSDAGLTLSYWTDATANTSLANYKAVSASGVYYIKATNPTTGCFVIKPVQVVIYNQPVAFAGLPETICPDSPYTLANATAQYYSALLWASSGDGTFDDATILKPVYTPGPNDMSLGTVTLTITAQGSGTGLGCVPAISSVTLTIIRINASVRPSDVTCYGANDGTIIITDFSGGSGSYEYRVDGFGWQSKSQYLNLAPGVYKVEMRDLLIPACVRELANITIVQPKPLSAKAEPQDATCLGNDGTISIVNPDGGSGSYEYSMNGGSWTTSGYFSGLVPGNYDIEMRDLNVVDCKKDLGLVTIAMPAPITAKGDKKDVSCFLGSDGQIIITDPKNGSGVYEFNIGAGWSSQMVFNNLTAGPYTVQMRDFNAKACVQDLGTITVGEPAPLGATISHKDISCFGSKDGSITIQSPTGGSGSYEYTIDGTIWASTASYTNLSAGEYYVLMRDKNAPTCVISFAVIEIIEPLPLTATVTPTNISCFGAHDGIIMITNPMNGTPGYQYSIDGLSWTAATTFTGLGTNTYTIQMRDVNGCKETIGTIFIIEPKPLIAVVNHTDETCVGKDGSITITNPQNSVSGLYEFTINGGSTWTSTGLFTGLASNTYTVKIRDASLKTCEQPLGNIRIEAPIPLAATASPTNVDCYGANNGVIAVKNPNGGSGLYEYSVDGATWTSTTTLANLAPAVYVLQMRDSKAIICEIQIGTYTITQPEQLAATASPTDVTCYGGKDGSISFSGVKGGSGSYEYSVDGINWFANKINNLIAGIYAVQIRDSAVKSCIVSLGSVEIKEPAKITAKLDFTPVTCFGASDGTITITNPKNGVPPYQYSLDGVKWQSGNVFTGLPAKVYNLLVISDANNCISTLAIITIIEPEKLEAKFTNTNETTPGANDGTITIIGQKGGSGTFEYSKDGTNWQASDVFIGLAPATYTILMRDANSITCSIPLTVVIFPAGSISAQYSFTPVTCFGGLDGSITFKNPIGATNYQFSVDGGTSWGLVNQLVFPGLAAQFYTLIVRDADNTANTNTLATIEIIQPSQLDAVVTATSETFAGAKDGAITISSPIGGSGTYDYSIDGTTWQASEQFPGLGSGIYNVEIRDRNATACRISIQKVIQPAGALIADVTHANVLCNGGNTGSILFSNASGATVIEFGIDNGSGTNWNKTGVFNGLTAGVYDVVIRDANNAINKVSLGKVTITQPLKLFPVFGNFTPPLCAGQTGSFSISAMGGTPPYTGVGDFVLQSGVSRIYIISDRNGCIAQQSVSMPDPPKILAAAVINSARCFGENGTVVISATGGTGALKGTGTFIVQAGKAYSFKVTDANGCSSNIVSGIMPPTEMLAVVITPVSSLCLGGSATVTVSATGGISPYITGTGTFTVALGTHTFTVTDSSGCSAVGSINITPKDPPVAPVLVVSALPNCITNTGTIKVTSPLGAVYQYSLDGGTYTSATTFDKLVAGSNHVVVVKDISTGCESVSTPITVDPLPNLPIAPIVSVTQPGCIVATGKIEVTEPAAGTGFEYRFDGGTYTSSTTIVNLLPGSTHTITIRNLLTGCVSVPTIKTIDLMPANPATPSATVTVKPTCNNPNGTVTVISPINSGGKTYAYSINGIDYQPSPVFGALTGTTTYTITVRDVQSGCTSSPTAIFVPAIPPSPVISVASFSPNCNGETYTITISAPPIVSAGKTYNFDGIYTFFYNLNEKFDNVVIKGGTATLTGQLTASKDFNNIRFEANGCLSAGTNTSIKIIVPDAIVIAQATVKENTLKGSQRGAIDITVIGGLPKLSYLWTSNTFTGTVTTEDLNNVANGTYTVTITDANNCSITKMIKIPLNNPPVAVADKYLYLCSAINENLLVNDYDPDPKDQNDYITINTVPVVAPKHFKTFKINTDGTFNYEVTAGYSGTDVFVYEIADKFGQTATATVSIDIVSDFDGDGIPDLTDPDADGDGILNVNEVLAGQDWKTTDSDGDGHPNWLDIDSDNDGIVDNVEAQTTKGYIAPSGIDKDKNGIDDAYDPAQGGTKIVPINTDLTLQDPDNIPDFLDVDSDNDWVPDYIEGHDLNADGKPDRIISGKDSDADGLDDVYDIVVKACNNGNATGSNSPLQDFDGDGLKDWRDNNDDDDEYLTRFEDLNADGDYSNDVIGHVGHPEYLWYGRDCELFVPDAFSPNDDNVHDYFQIYCIESYPNAIMYIFDQVGNKLYEKEHYGNLEFWGTPDRAWWDGTTSNRSATRNGNKVVPGTYYYVLRLGNGEVKKSFVFVSYPK
jgi:gliding motility-associated-like protein